MPSSRKLAAAVAALTLGICSCASRPVAYVGIYGTYEDRSFEIMRAVEEHDLDIRRLKVEPPAGVHSSVIIYGASKSAKITASEIAYSLYVRLGEWITVRPIEITNHRYSADSVGIYVLDNEYAEQRRGVARDAIVVVATNVYEVQDCENYLTHLTLGDANMYSLDGVEFDANDNEKRISLAGDYHLEHDRLILENAGERLTYHSEQVQLIEQEPLRRVKFVPELIYGGRSEAFGCSFLQELDVVIQN